jgi:hypothetical protein
MTMNGQMKLFHAYRNMKVDSVAIAGVDRGTKIRHRIVQRDAPSMTAASSRSFGMDTKNWRIRNVP